MDGSRSRLSSHLSSEAERKGIEKGKDQAEALGEKIIKKKRQARQKK
jgi:hypothetical protein